MAKIKRISKIILKYLLEFFEIVKEITYDIILGFFSCSWLRIECTSNPSWFLILIHLKLFRSLFSLLILFIHPFYILDFRFFYQPYYNFLLIFLQSFLTKFFLFIQSGAIFFFFTGFAFWLCLLVCLRFSRHISFF